MGNEGGEGAGEGEEGAGGAGRPARKRGKRSGTRGLNPKANVRRHDQAHEKGTAAPDTSDNT